MQFPNSAARLSYVQGLAKAISANAGVRVEGLSFTNMAKLSRSRADFAIIDAQCYATKLNWPILASARIGGSTSRSWALYSRLGSKLSDLRDKKLAYVRTGCNDSDFIDNAMFESEVDGRFFAARVNKTDLNGAVAEVATYRGAHAVFAPRGSQKGLSKVFDTGPVPNPAFVQLNSRLSDQLVAAVRKAVVGYGGAGAIEGWARGDDQPYRALRGRMGKRVKRAIFASPEPVGIDSQAVLEEPSTLGEIAFPQLRQNFEKPPERQE
ncbi:MAG: hypothetical protein AAGC55_13600 [Myxococcota bacterium]